MLAELGARLGFRTEVVESVEVVLNDHSIVKASSSICRWLVQQGRVRDVATVLGRPYRVGGLVMQGDRRGRTAGFPTANLAIEALPPADGVYAARATLPDGRTFPAAVNIGERPTFAGAARTFEAHLITGAPNFAMVASGAAGWGGYGALGAADGATRIRLAIGAGFRGVGARSGPIRGSPRAA